MLKWYAELFKFSGKELTPKALRRLKWLMLLSLPAYPLAATTRLGQFSDNMDLTLNIIYGISALCFVGLALTKFVNRFWLPDRYLDEWERTQKLDAMAFAFQITTYTLSIIFVLGILCDAFGFTKVTSFPPISIYGIGIIAGGTFMFGFYVMYAYMLFTIKPIVEVRAENEAGLNSLS